MALIFGSSGTWTSARRWDNLRNGGDSCGGSAMNTNTDILVNAVVQATLISLQREIDDGATIEELAEIIAGLLYFAQGQRAH